LLAFGGPLLGSMMSSGWSRNVTPVTEIETVSLKAARGACSHNVIARSTCAVR